MTGILVSKKDNGTKPNLPLSLRKYEQPDLLKALWQLSNTFIPYIILCILMLFSYKAGYSYWITLGLSIVAGSLLVRIFIFFHDCAHQSFFSSKKANTIFGYICGILTFTPYEDWRKSHGWHHNTFGDLDRRGMGDVWTLTAEESGVHTINYLKFCSGLPAISGYTISTIFGPGFPIITYKGPTMIRNLI